MSTFSEEINVLYTHIQRIIKAHHLPRSSDSDLSIRDPFIHLRFSELKIIHDSFVNMESRLLNMETRLKLLEHLCSKW